MKFWYIYSKTFTKYLHGTWSLINILMIFGIKEKSIILTHTMYFLAITANIQGHILLYLEYTTVACKIYGNYLGFRGVQSSVMVACGWLTTELFRVKPASTYKVLDKVVLTELKLLYTCCECNILTQNHCLCRGICRQQIQWSCNGWRHCRWTEDPAE